MTLHYGNPAAQNRSVDDVNFLLGAPHQPKKKESEKKGSSCQIVGHLGSSASDQSSTKKRVLLLLLEFRANRISLIDLLLQSSNAFHGPSKDAWNSIEDTIAIVGSSGIGKEDQPSWASAEPQRSDLMDSDLVVGLHPTLSWNAAIHNWYRVTVPFFALKPKLTSKPVSNIRVVVDGALVGLQTIFQKALTIYRETRRAFWVLVRYYLGLAAL